MAIKEGNKRITVTCTSQIEKELEWLSKNVYRKSKSKTLADIRTKFPKLTAWIEHG